VRHDFLGAVVAHADDAAAGGHERRRSPRQRHQRVGADIERDAKGRAAGVEELALERVLGGKRDGVQQQVQLAEAVSHLLEDPGNFLVARHIAGENEGIAAEGACEFFDVILEALALVGESQFRAGAVPGLRDGPGDRAPVGHAEDDS